MAQTTTSQQDPEREALHFVVDDVNVAENLQDLRVHIKQIAEQLLYSWKTFPIVLPPSITDEACDETKDKNTSAHVINFNDLFVVPTFDELEQVSLDTDGNPKRLNATQLESIRRTGEFEVESMNFAGQVHRWRLNLLLQRGTIRSNELFLDDASLALSMIIIHSRDRLCSNVVSVRAGFRSLRLGCWQILDILIGMPSMYVTSADEAVVRDLSQYLVAELQTRCITPIVSRETRAMQPDMSDSWRKFCNYFIEQCDKNKYEKDENIRTNCPPPPYKFVTPTGTNIDLRLFNSELMNKCMVIVDEILKQESKGWFIKYKDQLIAELNGTSMTNAEIKEYVNRCIQEKYVERVIDAILRSDSLERLQPNIGVLLVNQGKFSLAVTRCQSEIEAELDKYVEECRAELIKDHPTAARIKRWMDEKLSKQHNQFLVDHAWTAHQLMIQRCEQEALDQIGYFLQRDLIFQRDREPVVRRELERVRYPNRVFYFTRYIWLPRHWIVTKHHCGKNEIVPTVISNVPLDDIIITEPDQPTYSLEKTKVYETSTRYPFWRWNNIFHRTFIWTLNSVFVLGVVIPWCSPVGIRALFCRKPFMANHTINPSNGVVCPDPNSRTQTLASRLSALWRNIRLSRQKFEAEPDRGLLGKSVTRVFNQLWNNIIKGVAGSVIIVTVGIPLCLCASFLCIIAGLTAPLWMPFASLFAHITATVLYDFDRPVIGCRVFYLFEALIFRLFIRGLCQPIIALLSAIFVLPVTSLAILTAGGIRRFCRMLWDSFIFHAIIKSRGRVPAKDGFIVRRTHGPGIASNYFYQVRAEQALAAVEARMEVEELELWRSKQLELIGDPKETFKKFVRTCFAPFSSDIVTTGVYDYLVKETQVLERKLNEKYERRRNKLNSGMSRDVQNRVRLTARELKIVVTQTAAMLESFYPDRILSRLTEPVVTTFWENKQLEQNDWQGLAAQILSDIFSSSFLTPLEDSDTCFNLQVEHLDLGRYLHMLESTQYRDDLDVVNPVYAAKADIDIVAPSLSNSIFSFQNKTWRKHQTWVLAQRPALRGVQWMRISNLFENKSLLKYLQTPLLIAHPVLINILIYNRGASGSSIPVDSAISRSVLDDINNIPYADPPSLLQPADLEQGRPTTLTQTTDNQESKQEEPRDCEKAEIGASDGLEDSPRHAAQSRLL